MRSTTKKTLGSALLAAGLFLSSGMALAAPIVIDFNAVSLRGANAVPHDKPDINEYANGNGVTIGDLVPGQKAYYGTSYFGGAMVSSIDTITFSYKPTVNGQPYLNLSITNGLTTGILALGAATTTTDIGGGAFTAVFDLSSASLAFYERVGADPLFGTLDYSDIASWTFVSGNRPLSAGEDSAFGDPRGPVSDSLAILWGDSSNNYLGVKDIYNVSIAGSGGSTAPALAFVAGNIPEPASLALVGIALFGLATARRRH